MTINEPNRKAVCFHCDVDIKYSLAQLAKYHKTTITNLLEEGARMVIHRESMRMKEDMSDLNVINSIVRH